MTSEKTGRGAILSLGRIYCDFIFTGLAGMPRLGRELFAEEMTLAAGGGAFITAAHAAALGRETALLARFGTDALSQAIEPQLALPGIELRFLDRHASAGPQVTVVMVEEKERAFLSRRAGTAAPATLEAALSWPRARHLHIAEYATLAETEGVVAKAKAHGLGVSLDPSWDDSLIGEPDFLDRCAGVDVFMPNLEEARALTGKEAPREALQALAERFPVVVLKMGAEGALASAGGQVTARAAPQVRVVDTTGAGDAFNAGFLDAWIEGAAMEGCLSAAIAAGTRSVQAAGGASMLAAGADSR